MRNWIDKDTTIWIELPEPFDFKVNLDYLKRDLNECLYEVMDDTVLKVIFNALVKVSSDDNKYLVVEFLSGDIPKTMKDKEKFVSYVSDWFDLDTDLEEFYIIAGKDKLLKETIDRFYGLRTMGIPDLFEALCWGILGQQINIGFAYTLKRQFVEKFGDYIEYENKKYWIFPSYDTIAKLEPGDMTGVQLTKRKIEYIIGVAKEMSSGRLSKKELLEMNDFKKAEKALVKIRGIGPWTANYVLMRCLRYTEGFPIADVGLMNSIKYLLDMDRKPTKEEILELSAGWSHWESYATFYLWRLKY